MSGQDNPYPTIAFVLARRKVMPVAAALLILVIFAWFAWRAASVDLAVLGLILAVAGGVVVKLLIEIVALVADTLMPR